MSNRARVSASGSRLEVDEVLEARLAVGRVLVEERLVARSDVDEVILVTVAPAGTTNSESMPLTVASLATLSSWFATAFSSRHDGVPDHGREAAGVHRVERVELVLRDDGAREVLGAEPEECDLARRRVRLDAERLLLVLLGRDRRRGRLALELETALCSRGSQ